MRLFNISPFFTLLFSIPSISNANTMPTLIHQDAILALCIDEITQTTEQEKNLILEKLRDSNYLNKEALIIEFPESVNWTTKKYPNTLLQTYSYMGYGPEDGNFNFIKFLIMEGADPNLLGQKEPRESSPLFNAVHGGGHPRTVSLLLKHVKDPNDGIPKKESLIHLIKNPKVLKILIDDGRIDIKQLDDMGRSILDHLLEEYVRWNEEWPKFYGENYLEQCLYLIKKFFTEEEILKAKKDFFSTYYGKTYLSLGLIKRDMKVLKP